jgi:serine/threonine-protein kinase
MPPDRVSALVAALRQTGLLDDEQKRQLAAGAFGDPDSLARELVRRGWLTMFQARQLLRGHGTELVLGPYLLLERLGRGGMGQVYKARHRPMKRVVALKVLRPDHVADPAALQRFRREMQAAAQLSHPNIVTVFDAAQVGDVHFLAMEYIDGLDLSALVHSSGPVSVPIACDYIRQAAAGLHHAHEHGLIHRDVKPSNMLVTTADPAGVVKVLDLGLARPIQIAGRGDGSSLTIDGTIVGTPDFMAPEQAKNSRTVDRRADLYSLGCTLYYLLAGRLPFPDGTAMDKLMQHQFEQPFPLELVRPDMPPGLLAVLQRLIAKKPEERFQTGEETAAALGPFCDNGAVVVEVRVPVPSPDQGLPAPMVSRGTPSRATVFIVLGAILVLILIGVSAVVALSR